MDDHKSKTMYGNIKESSTQQIRKMFEEPTFKDDPTSFALAKKFYRSCMNETVVEMEGLRKMKDILRDIAGWPILEGNNWVENEFDWKRITQKLRKIGCCFEFFITIKMDVSKINPGNHMIHVSKYIYPSFLIVLIVGDK